MKNKLSKGAAAALVMSTAFLSVNVLPVKSAHAVIGAAIGNAPIAIAGLVTMMVGPFAGLAAEDEKGPSGYNDDTYDDTLKPFLLIGLIVLDADSSNGFSFTAINEQQALHFNLSASETQAYNANVDELSAVAETVSAELSLEKHPSVEASRRLWAKYAASLDPQAFVAAIKVANSAIGQKKR